MLGPAGSQPYHTLAVPHGDTRVAELLMMIHDMPDRRVRRMCTEPSRDTVLLLGHLLAAN